MLKNIHDLAHFLIILISINWTLTCLSGVLSDSWDINHSYLHLSCQRVSSNCFSRACSACLCVLPCICAALLLGSFPVDWMRSLHFGLSLRAWRIYSLHTFKSCLFLFFSFFCCFLSKTIWILVFCNFWHFLIIISPNYYHLVKDFVHLG